MADTVKLSVRVSRELAQAAETAIAARDIDTSTLLRHALEYYLQSLAGTTPAERRKQFASEYTFLALDLILQQQYPEVRIELLEEAERRMEAIHGAA